MLQGSFPVNNTVEDGYEGLSPVDAFPMQNHYGKQWLLTILLVRINVVCSAAENMSAGYVLCFCFLFVLTILSDQLSQHASASEVTTLWRYINLFIIIIIFFKFFIPQVV